MLHDLTPNLRKILGNAGWLMSDKIIRMGIGIFIGAWSARYLGPSQFGSLNFAIAFVSLFTVFANLGLDGIVIRDIIRSPASGGEVLGTTLSLRVTGSFLVVLVAVGAIRMSRPYDVTSLVLVGVVALGQIFQSFDTIDLFFQSQVQSKLTVWAKNAASLVTSGIKILLIYFKAPLWTFAAVLSAELALGAAALVMAYELSGGHILRWRSSLSRARELLRQSWPLVLSGMAIAVYMRIDMVMLKMMQGDAAVGVYAAATKVSEVWYFIPVAIVSSVTPAIMRARDNPELYYKRVQALFTLMTMLAFSIGSVVALGSRWIIQLLFSSGYQSSAPVLAVHIWASVFVFLGVAQGPWDVSENLLRLSLYRTVAGAVANIALNLLLIPRYSALGAAISTVVCYALAAVFANALSRRTRHIFLLQMKSFLFTSFHLEELRAKP
jgi:PST family polysaccharide transporter